jgi:fucose 4-O-acetylase-like acetyltransferase
MNTNNIVPQVATLVLVLVALVLFRKFNRNRPAPLPATSTTAPTVNPKPASARMNRVQKVSKGIRIFLQYGIPLLVVGLLAFGVLAARYKLNLPKPEHPAPNVNLPSFGLWGTFSLIVYLFWYRTTLKLFCFFEQGILFTAETVRCIQILGVIYFIRFLVQVALNFALAKPDWLGTDLSDLFTSFLIIFIGWLIDEARKIREEQELTV